VQAPVEVPDSSDAVWRKGQPAVSERAVGREPPFDRLGGRRGAPIAARRVPRRPNDRGDLGAILREDARYDLLHVVLVVDDMCKARPGNRNTANGPRLGRQGKEATPLPQPRPDAKLPQRRRRAKSGGLDFVKGQNSHDGWKCLAGQAGD
jgi:hypothetical protein